MKPALKILLPVAVLASAAGATALVYKLKNQVSTRPPERLAPVVRTVEIRSEDIQVRIASRGTVRPRTQSTLMAQVAGEIEWTSPAWASGGFFAEDDLLLRVDSTDYELAKVTAEAQLAQAKLQLAQEEEEAAVARAEWQSIAAENPDRKPTPLVLHEPQIALARAQVKAAQAGVRKAEVDLSRTEIRAAYEGRVRELQADLGQVVSPGTPLGTLYSTDAAEVRLPIPKSQLRYVDLPLTGKGSRAERAAIEVLLKTTLGDRELAPWRGEIVRTEGEIDPKSGMVHAVARVEDPYTTESASADGQGPLPLTVGLFVEAEILGKTFRNVSQLPRHALRRGQRLLVVETSQERAPATPVAGREEADGSTGVANAEGAAAMPAAAATDKSTAHQLRYRAVEVIRKTSSTVLIDLDKSDVQSGDRVCVSPLEIVVDGMRVRVEGASQP